MPKGLLQVNNFFLDEESSVLKIIRSQRREPWCNEFFHVLRFALIDNLSKDHVSDK